MSNMDQSLLLLYYTTSQMSMPVRTLPMEQTKKENLGVLSVLGGEIQAQKKCVSTMTAARLARPLIYITKHLAGEALRPRPWPLPAQTCPDCPARPAGRDSPQADTAQTHRPRQNLSRSSICCISAAVSAPRFSFNIDRCNNWSWARATYEGRVTPCSRRSR
jgi:hypothetical protein